MFAHQDVPWEYNKHFDFLPRMFPLGCKFRFCKISLHRTHFDVSFQFCFLFHRRWWKRCCDSRRVEDACTSHALERVFMLLGVKRSHCRADCTAIFRDPQNRRASRKLQHVLHHKNIDRNSWLYNSRYLRFHHDWHCDRTLSRVVSSPSLKRTCYHEAHLSRCLISLGIFYLVGRFQILDCKWQLLQQHYYFADLCQPGIHLHSLFEGFKVRPSSRERNRGSKNNSNGSAIPGWIPFNKDNAVQEIHNDNGVHLRHFCALLHPVFVR